MHRGKELYFGRVILTLSFLFFFFKCGSTASNIEYAVLAAESSSVKENFCIVHFTAFSVLPKEKSDAEFHLLEIDRKSDWCEEHPEKDPKNKVLLLSDGNCSITSQALNIQDQGGKGVLFIIPSGEVDNYNVNFSESVNITVGLISETSAEKLEEMDNTTTVKLFSPANRGFDFSLLVIFLIAMFTVSVGSYWSGHLRFAIYCKEMSALPGNRELPNKPLVKILSKEDSSMNIPAYAVAIFVGFMTTMLLLLYFFFDYLVYFIIGLFMLASIISVYSCLQPWILSIPGSLHKFEFHCCNTLHHVNFCKVFTSAVAIGVSVFWVIVRKDEYAWVLQDILGVTFCIHMLKTIRISSFKTCVILQLFLFIYDIFFVFVTPFLTEKGVSVMEAVATARKSRESLPMVLKVAHFRFNPINVCYQQYSLLGFGDILVPGLLISYCHGFDLITSKRKTYFPLTVTSYGVGMLLTFMGLFVMSTAQPALLYLVPCTTLPPLILGWCRGELKSLWNGFVSIQPTDGANYPDVQVAANVPGTEVQSDTSVPRVENHASKDSVNPREKATDDRKYLLQ